MTTPEQPTSEQATSPAAPTAPAAPVAFHGAIPILRVRDLDASVDHYVRALGFAVDWQTPHVIASVSRGRCTLFLSEGDQGHAGSWAWIGVADAAALHDELRARGATIRQPPTNFAWALELQVQDPDGNVLRLGSDPLPDVPFGPWLDMAGHLWRATPDGRWTSESAMPEASGIAPPALAVSEVAPPELASPDLARSLKSQGEAARRAGDHAEARRLYEEAVALERELDDPLELAHTVRHLGDVLHDARLPHLAEPHYVEALALYRAHPAPPPLNLANALRSHAVLKQEIGESDKARRLWEEACRLYQQVDVREGVAESAGWAARLAWRAGDLSRARDWLAAARAASDASSDAATWKFVREVGLELGG